MRREGKPHWRVQQIWWDQSLDLALWMRHRLGIPIEAGGLVPAGLDEPHRPGVLPAFGNLDEFRAGWADWWQGLVSAARPMAHDSSEGLAPPEFHHLAPWPTFQEAVVAEWQEGNTWHSERKVTGVRQRPQVAGQSRSVVAEVESLLGRPVHDFDLELLLLPVREEQIRKVSSTRYLIPERVYGSTAWPTELRGIIAAIA